MIDKKKRRELSIPFGILSTCQHYTRIIIPAITNGRIIDLYKVQEKYSGADIYCFSKTEGTSVWGNKIQIKKICKKVSFVPSRKLLKVRGIVFPTIVGNCIFGRDGNKLSKLQEEHPKAKISFNSITQVMLVSGDLNQVNIVCKKVANAIKSVDIGDKRTRQAQKRRKNKKNKQHKSSAKDRKKSQGKFNSKNKHTHINLIDIIEEEVVKAMKIVEMERIHQSLVAQVKKKEEQEQQKLKQKKRQKRKKRKKRREKGKKKQQSSENES